MSDETPIFTDQGLAMLELIWARGPVWCWYLDPRAEIQEVVPRLFSLTQVTYRGRGQDGKEREFEMPIEVLSLPDHDAVIEHAQAYAAERERNTIRDRHVVSSAMLPLILAELGLEEGQIETCKTWLAEARARRGAA